MTSTNIPTLYQNILYGLPDEFARDVFLWATEQPENDRHCYKAETFARRVSKLHSEIRPLIDKSARTLNEHDPSLHLDQYGRDDLLKFILKRQANMEFGGNVDPAYLTEARK